MNAIRDTIQASVQESNQETNQDKIRETIQEASVQESIKDTIPSGFYGKRAVQGMAALQGPGTPLPNTRKYTLLESRIFQKVTQAAHHRIRKDKVNCFVQTLLDDKYYRQQHKRALEAVEPFIQTENNSSLREEINNFISGGQESIHRSKECFAMHFRQRRCIQQPIFVVRVVEARILRIIGGSITISGLQHF